jgi:hypothetical protein
MNLALSSRNRERAQCLSRSAFIRSVRRINGSRCHLGVPCADGHIQLIKISNNLEKSRNLKIREVFLDSRSELEIRKKVNPPSNQFRRIAYIAKPNLIEPCSIRLDMF